MPTLIGTSSSLSVVCMAVLNVVWNKEGHSREVHALQQTSKGPRASVCLLQGPGNNTLMSVRSPGTCFALVPGSCRGRPSFRGYEKHVINNMLRLTQRYETVISKGFAGQRYGLVL